MQSSTPTPTIAAPAEPSPAPDSQPPPPGSAPKLLAAVVIFLLAVWPRLTGLETFVTTDELFWAGRSGNFARALAGGRLEHTFQSGHPGVTTMWVGLLGMGPERAQRLAGERLDQVSRRQVSSNQDFLPALFAARRWVAIISAALVAVAVLLAWRLLGGGPAFVGGALLALDPFHLAHSQLLHLDALLAGFMTVGLLAGLVRWLAGGGRRYLVLSAVASGLALLSKSPALFLVGFLPLVAALAAWRRGELLTRPVWRDLLAWGALVGLTYAVCWPALWVAPLDVLRGIGGFIDDNTDPDQNALFYPLAFLLRTTPLVLVGLVLLLIEGAVRRRRAGEEPAPTLPLAHSPTLALAAYAVLFGLAMTVAAKSFDRYLLPAFPAVDLLAGLGLALSARRLRWIGGAGLLLAGAFILPLLVYPVGTSLPYALTWYNPLAGGGPAAQRVLAVGWGEGLDQVARYLNLKPNAERLKVALPGEIYTTVLDAQLVGQVMPAEDGDPAANDADYFVTYVRAERDGSPAVYDPRFQTWQPELVVRLAGLEYAGVYDAARGVPLGASFGSIARLEGYGVTPLATRSGRPLGVRLFWRALAAPPADTQAIVQLLDPAGREVARAEVPLGGLEAGQTRSRSYQLTPPAGLPPGEYQLWVSLESAPDQPLPLDGRPAALAPGAPEHPSRAILRTVQLR